MDGRGRALDNVFIERLWRSVKYEERYLREYPDGWTAEESLARYFEFYCEQRIQESLGYRTPATVRTIKDSSRGGPIVEDHDKVSRSTGGGVSE
ncbi:MAG: transposase [Planctomycetaceae bacterium]|nr:transposase [Planctomycetaceae bacterium]